MNSISRRPAGFTIVELLIVIVVIGILAAIVIVAYNGVQQRADNAKTISTVSNYYKALIHYASVKASYPGSNACLGEPAYTSCVGAPDATFNTALKPYMGNSLPQPSTKIYQYIGGPRAGASYNVIAASTVDGVSHPWGINYVLGGNVKCEISNVVGNPSGSGWPTFSRTPNPSGATERSSEGNTYCRLILPDPSQL